MGTSTDNEHGLLQKVIRAIRRNRTQAGSESESPLQGNDLTVGGKNPRPMGAKLVAIRLELRKYLGLSIRLRKDPGIITPLHFHKHELLKGRVEVAQVHLIPRLTGGLELDLLIDDAVLGAFEDGLVDNPLGEGCHRYPPHIPLVGPECILARHAQWPGLRIVSETESLAVPVQKHVLLRRQNRNVVAMTIDGEAITVESEFWQERTPSVVHRHMTFPDLWEE